MGEIIPFPGPRAGCSRWHRAQGAITLSARPACAALAQALASSRDEADRSASPVFLFR